MMGCHTTSLVPRPDWHPPQTLPSLTVCRPSRVFARRIATCPCCQQRRRIVGMMQAWYDTVWTCCGCGDSWAGGELMPRPFRRGWREDAIAGARQYWAEGVSMREASALITAQVAAETGAA